MRLRAKGAVGWRFRTHYNVHAFAREPRYEPQAFGFRGSCPQWAQQKRKSPPRSGGLFLFWWASSERGVPFSSTPYISDIFTFRATPPFKDQDLLHQKYVVERLPPREIAKQIFSSRQSVVKHLKLFGIPLRSEDLRLTGRQVFGYKQRRQRPEIHQREQAEIKKMQELRNQGLTYQKIAEILNVMGISTKRGKKRWYAKTVRSVILRARS